MNEGFYIVVYRVKATGIHDLCYRTMNEYGDTGEQFFRTEEEAIRVRDRLNKIFAQRHVDHWVKYVAWGEFA